MLIFLTLDGKRYLKVKSNAKTDALAPVFVIISRLRIK